MCRARAAATAAAEITVMTQPQVTPGTKGRAMQEVADSDGMRHSHLFLPSFLLPSFPPSLFFRRVAADVHISSVYSSQILLLLLPILSLGYLLLPLPLPPLLSRPC